jgi:hypothetical protein
MSDLKPIVMSFATEVDLGEKGIRKAGVYLHQPCDPPGTAEFIGPFTTAIQAHDWCVANGYDPYYDTPPEIKQKNLEYIQREKEAEKCTDLPLFAERRTDVIA